jgi:L,D-peptidoglycan transpeptidase YkuD (ErfK/YbiS/YcfS/YnhG family)
MRKPAATRPGARPSRRGLRRIVVHGRPGRPSQGWLAAGQLHLAVALGAAGIRANKREGDKATPRGTFRPIRLWWRADRLARPRTFLPVRRIGREDGWCEDPDHRRYNRSIRVAKDAPGDRLWRQDGLYDLLIELDHNARPRVAGRGSAVFVHLARPGLRPTAGCVALGMPALRRLLTRITARTEIVIE